MKFVRHLLMLLLLCVIGCDKRTSFTLEGIIFDFSSNLGPLSQKRISEGILLQRKFLNPDLTSELAKVVKIRIDSIPFSYIFFIPFRDSIKKETNVAFDVFAVTLSEDLFDNTPVHIILTDDDFKPRKEYPFFKTKSKNKAYGMMSSQTDILAVSTVPKVKLDDIERMLLSDLSELYKSGEKVVVDILQGEKGIDIEITIDDSMINGDTLNSQFTKMNQLPWLAIFDGKPVRFIVKNKYARVIYKSI